MRLLPCTEEFLNADLQSDRLVGFASRINAKCLREMHETIIGGQSFREKAQIIIEKKVHLVHLSSLWLTRGKAWDETLRDTYALALRGLA